MFAPSENSRNAQSLLNSLVSDLSAAVPLAAEQTMTRGQELLQGDYSLALLAKDVYSLTGQGAEGFSRLSDEALLGFGIDPVGLQDAASGFQAGIYADEQHYVLAFMCWLSRVPYARLAEQCTPGYGV